MRQNLDLLLLLYWMFMTSTTRSTSTPRIDIGICLREPLTCCSGFRKVDRECRVCWPGTYGLNCNETCPEGWYGLFCREKCGCSPCDKVTGCASDINHSEGEVSVTDFINWKMFALTISTIFGVCVVVGIIKYCRQRVVTTAPSDSSGKKDICESNRYQNHRILNKDHGGRVEESCASHTTRGFPSNKQNNTTASPSPQGTRMDTEPKQEADCQSNTANNVYDHIAEISEQYATLSNLRKNKPV